MSAEAPIAPIIAINISPKAIPVSIVGAIS